jgi:hypothetical protein
MESVRARTNGVGITGGRSQGSWRTISFLVAVAMVGCADQPGDETVEEDALSIFDDDGVCGAAYNPDRDRDHRFHNRCRHYRQRKHRFRRQKVGNAQLSVRTLIDKNRDAMLEVTTGTFDDGSVAPGTLEKLVVDIAPISRKRRDDLMFKPRSGGYFSTSLGKLIHGQALDVDATISGIHRWKDRISVDDKVRYRPDLAVSHVDVARSASAGLPVSIAATVREMKGDLGAKADCVLSVDGQIVDRAAGIWVDAADVVTCHFSHTFAATGQHALRVDVGNVTPGDYDMSNNSGNAMVEVASEVAFSGDAYDATYAGTSANEVLDSAGNVLYRNDSSWSGVIQSISVTANWPVPVAFPLAAVSGTATSAGATWPLVGVGNVAADSSDATQGTCAARSDTTGFNWITVCTTGSDGSGATTVNVSSFAGDVTYHSEGACQQTTSFQDCESGFTWNNSNNSQFATRHTFAGSVTISLSLSDAAGTTLQAAPVIPLAAYTSQNDVPPTCEMQEDKTKHCFRHQYLETGVRGAEGL